MVRRSRPLALAAFVCAALTAACSAAAQSQSLPRLHVLSFVMKTDAQAPMIGRAFHLEISGRVAERVAAVDFVVLPNLADLEPLGDERHAIVAPGGTSFSETLTVAPRHAGTMHLGAAYFDAIDARDGKPKRYYSNDLVINVGAPPVAQEALGSLTTALARLVGALLIVFVLGAAVLGRRRGRLAATAAVPSEPEPRAAAPAENGVLQALAQLKEIRDRSAVMALREEMWKDAGGRRGETLSDLISRNGIAGALRTSLNALERAAFVSDAYLGAAIDDAIGTVEKQLT